MAIQSNPDMMTVAMTPLMTGPDHQWLLQPQLCYPHLQQHLHPLLQGQTMIKVNQGQTMIKIMIFILIQNKKGMKSQ